VAIHLSDHQELLDDLGANAAEVLQSVWQDAARVFSPRGLEAYLRGAATLKALGRGTDLVVTFIESAPFVAKEIGEEAVAELLTTGIRLSSKTSAQVIVLVFATAPTAAARLGEGELFRAYLALLDTILSQAPRALRPMLGKLDVLLGHLTLGGLRRWALWGISAYRADFEGQTQYFGLESPEAQAILQKEQRGVLFVDVQRRLIMYLRALWGRDFYMRPTSGDFESRAGYKPYIEHYFIHLPDAYDDVVGAQGAKVAGLEIYRAAAAHCAAHMVYSRLVADDGLTPIQKACIGLVDDARVEWLAVAIFPGLAHLWCSLLPADRERSDMTGLWDRAARALLDADYQDDHALVAFVRDAFFADRERWHEPAIARRIGLAWAERVVAAGFSFNVRTDCPSSPYRDDNRYLWEQEEGGYERLSASTPQVRKYVSLMEMMNTLDVETAGDDAQEIWTLATELYDDDGKTFNELEGKDPISSPFSYAEFDYQTQLERPSWVTLFEKRPKAGDPAVIDAVIEKYKPLVRRLKFLIESMQPQGVTRLRKVEDGDEIDINAAIEAMVDVRMGRQPDPRIGIRTRLQIRDLSVLLLIDLSESTNDRVRGADGDATVLQLARDAASLLADAMAKIGDPFAIHGFDSNGRHDVEYYRFKEFDAPYDDVVKGRLAGMTGRLSTRMGAALRHAGSLLAHRSSRKKLVLLLTDGEPSDNDVRDPQYLRFDTKKAVEELGRQGTTVFCLTLDPYADQYVSRIFGAQHYMILDHVARLPERLPALYLALTK